MGTLLLSIGPAAEPALRMCSMSTYGQSARKRPVSKKERENKKYKRNVLLKRNIDYYLICQWYRLNKALLDKRFPKMKNGGTRPKRTVKSEPQKTKRHTRSCKRD